MEQKPTAPGPGFPTVRLDRLHQDFIPLKVVGTGLAAAGAAFVLGWRFFGGSFKNTCRKLTYRHAWIQPVTKGEATMATSETQMVNIDQAMPKSVKAMPGTSARDNPHCPRRTVTRRELLDNKLRPNAHPTLGATASKTVGPAPR